MKRTLIILFVFGATGLRSNSQNLSFSFNLDVPHFTAPAKENPTAFGLGLNLQTNYNFSKAMAVSAQTGYRQYFQLKDNKVNGDKLRYGLLPVLAGFRITILDRLTIQNLVGYSSIFNVSKQEKVTTSSLEGNIILMEGNSKQLKGTLTWSPSFGWKFNRNWELSGNLYYDAHAANSKKTDTKTSTIVTTEKSTKINPFSAGLQVRYHL